MRRSFICVALLASLALVAASCANGSGNTAGGSRELNRDATLRMAWHIPAVPFDPHTNTSTVAAFPYLSLVYDRLTQVVATPEGPQVAPMVAKSWEFSEGGTVLTFQLRDDVTFHDGAQLTAEAVQRSLHRALTLEDSTVDDDLAVIERVEAVDTYTVRLQLTRPAADVLLTLATTAGAIINPKALRNNLDLTQNPAGSGPYTLAELRLGDRAAYQRYEDYWDPNGGKVARIEIVGIPDGTARLNALRSGQADVTFAKITQYDQVEQLAAGDQFGLVSQPPRSWYELYLNTGRAPLDNVTVRQALNFAINREAINSTILNGQCRPTSQPLQKGAAGHAPSREGAYSYNPAKAKRLLAQAGVGNGFKLDTVATAGSSSVMGLAKVLQAQLGKVGIKVDIRAMAFAQAVSTYQKGNADSFMFSHPAAASSAVTLQDAYLSPNFPGTLPDGYRQLIHKAVDSTLGDAARTKALQQASTIASQQAFGLFVCAYGAYFSHDSDVVGLDHMAAPGQGGPFDLRYVGKTNE